MLHLLVDFLSGIIRILAAACVIGATAIGYKMAPDLEVAPWVGALIGFSAGFLAASLGGGLIACLILIENHLRVLAEAQVHWSRQPPPVAANPEPAEQSSPPPAPAYQPYRRPYGYQSPAPSETDRAAGKPENAEPGQENVKK